ncbi:UDP-3-O-(3-hydroxymyristoyl) N-acetylglucosamine deacetylase [Leptolyngbya boryana NIES-2135]|jgi:UDP-3-O-[3-hydroxymyristoyl] N-acetylglucosamine deacetylase|uniref:UDP-3-O-acyl-N-acetylglucosamine deacetylase n=1 Tax=Leptolyngbya boryana NIES-2135 TaxID=1973484 RepID=A0A1Z4JPD5_LEPBY|nr:MULTISPECIES: UDP-3-O-acyl-N-acetylglucosamine deacetylase [Leptolyngbya]ULP29655.1 UDP-3-O-acyl-N-acetylglucosamine deacetylase [Leptolyngbya boryana IU 594]BAS55267.1 UDP-3-O-(3-hydroxymyristoyl) N-acetylglucosamine deacetylase [Leptolyngbya boryana IAM M-101]BAS61615.1 UDP-3-O-(3-hydroxymyristoyl) N-acetylglucosamine deacetylase [Leptolyngbya boryana dg5]BAY58589.1 UDP-3-O-(3-hydroxymyristoyl) N-acetylglucosamine deacetylase [Leptolyngbya boryana NIES-2135]
MVSTQNQGRMTRQVQRSLRQSFSCYGVGLHSGEETTARVLPAEPGRGRYFVRTDLPGAPEIPARIESVRETMLSTELVNGDARIRTVEHLLASLTGMGIDNARIEVDGAEIPLLDGSARSWTSAIAQAGIVEQTEEKSAIVISEPVFVRHGDAFVAALPSSELRFSYGIDFDLSAIGNQWHSWKFDPETFATEIAPARTFGLAHQIEQLRANGLIKGGSLENALVCSSEGWINPPLRFSNEPARHKLLDLIGDLSLLGTLPTAHFLAYKASHELHTQLVRQLSEILPAHF